MQYVVSSDEMKYYDNYTINEIGIPSLLLMERAAIEMARVILEESSKEDEVVVFAGCGNNGGDALAIGRILTERGMQVTFYMPGDKTKVSIETNKQIEILENIGFSILSKLPEKEYDIMIDGLFGIGLSRSVTGVYARAIEEMNTLKEKKGKIFSVDIPSGVCADTGKVLGCAVRADVTVSFEFAKIGHYLYPGKELTGKLKVCNIGITHKAFAQKKPSFITADAEDLKRWLPRRASDGNKGTFGKVLLFAGNKEMCGAAILCGKAVLSSGAGMLKIIAPEENKETLYKVLPEAMLCVYENEPERDKLLAAVSWADVLVAGPGIGKNNISSEILEILLENGSKPFVLDADALNLIAENERLIKELVSYEKNKIIMTPHPGEFVRLANVTMDEYKSDVKKHVKSLAERYGCVMVGKDASTIVAEQGEDTMYINHIGNDGMAVAGSGDVLAGIIGGLAAQGLTGFQAAKCGVLLHAAAGDKAAETKSRYGMMTSDILDGLFDILGEMEEKRN